MTQESWQRIKALFESALDREGPDRAAFVQQVSEREHTVGVELQRLLAEHEQAGSFLEQPHVLAQSQLSESFEGEPAPGAVLMPGDRLGSYEIIRELGHGGMGSVYLAERADGQYRKQVAIKLVIPHPGASNILRRFRNERQVLAALDHLNIARLLDGGATGGGLPYLVMEYVEGVRIDAWCDGRRLPIRNRVELFRKVCAAVQYAHEKQVIHRDIKPGNLLVTEDGTPKLLDFGIAKVLNPDLAAETLETAGGPGPMTPEHASPEQVRGGLIGPASDVYSLGVMLYHLLTGQLPHSIQGRDSAQLAQAICEQEPIRPSAAAVVDEESVSQARGVSRGSLRRVLRGDLDNIVMKALRKEPERRYGSVAELSDDLERFLLDRPVRARDESRVYRARKYLKRNRTAAGLSAALMVVLLLLVGTTSGLFNRLSGTHAAVQSIAVLPLENLSREPEQELFADGMTVGLIAGLGKISSLRVISRDSVMRYKNVHKPAASAARELNAGAIVQGSVQRAGDRVRIAVQLRTGTMDRIEWSRTYERELPDAPAVASEAAKDIAREMEVRVTPQESARLSIAHRVDQQSFEACLKGRYLLDKHTVEGYLKGLQYFQEAVERDPAYALAWAGLAEAYSSLSEMHLPPHEAMPKAKAAARRALELDEGLVEAQTMLAAAQSQYDWDWPAAEASFKRTIRLNPSYSRSHIIYSFYLAQQGRMDEAIEHAAEANRLDPLPPAVPTNLAWMYTLARRPDEAIALCRRILELGPELQVTHNTLAGAYVQKRMFEQAIAELRKAQSMSEFRLEGGLAYIYAVSGRTSEARRTLAEFLEYSRRGHVDAHDVAVVYGALGEKDKAFEWLDKAYQERSEGLLMIKVNPWLDSLRSDPRFTSLVRRIGLPP